VSEHREESPLPEIHQIVTRLAQETPSRHVICGNYRAGELIGPYSG